MVILRTAGAFGPVEKQIASMSRRSFFQSATAVGTTGALALLGGSSSVFGQEPEVEGYSNHNHLKRGDLNILVAAEIAEALAVTTYTNIINTSPFFTRIPSDDQGYLVAAREEEMSHYLLEQSVTSENTPFTTFYYPPNMFLDPQTTLNTLVSLEDAFIAAYLIGVRNFSTTDLRLTAARIMGIESDHRTLARVVGGDVASQDGGPLSTITGLQGVAESIAPPNNNGYERTLCLTHIEQAVQALLPFVDVAHATSAGFDTSKSYQFEPFNPTLPSPLGEFISFTGC